VKSERSAAAHAPIRGNSLEGKTEFDVRSNYNVGRVSYLPGRVQPTHVRYARIPGYVPRVRVVFGVILRINPNGLYFAVRPDYSKRSGPLPELSVLRKMRLDCNLFIFGNPSSRFRTMSSKSGDRACQDNLR